MNSHTELAGLPAGARNLLGTVEIYSSLDAVALREMSKFSEMTNVRGLPVHPITRPPDPDGLLESSGLLEDLPTAVFVKLRETLRARPQILLRGAFAGSMQHAFPIAAFFPQDAAHLARAWDALIWRDASPTPAEPALTLLHLPDFEEPILLSLPDEGVALILGTDDPRPGLFVALEWANRHWKARNELIQLKRLPAETEPSVVLAGGSFVFEDLHAAETPAAPVLIFPGESIPVSWEETLRESLPALAGLADEDLLLAEAEPWCGEGGGRAAPFWRNPILPAPLVEASGRWREPALHPDALPFGLVVTATGEIDWKATPDDAFVIAPRSAVPAPFPRAAASLQPTRHYTHRAMKPEAMELWAMGFPSPEVLGPGGGH